MLPLDSQFVRCPWCGERFEALIDASAGDADYTEDCPVCCRPIAMHLHGDDDAAELWVERE
ncbi:MAG: CPXCG motif-containing cysteine-rich protein [Xanthomonadales bacterium]|nr:CPXCG motif-containing cysteine-rich protein [Xanthomonadales bacterium]